MTTAADTEFPSDRRLQAIGAFEEDDARRILKALLKYPNHVVRMACFNEPEARTIKAKLKGLGADVTRVFFSWVYR